MRTAIYAALLFATGTVLPAQNVLHGNGIPSAYVENTAGLLGGTLSVGFGSPNTPNGFAVVSISGSFTPFVFPFPQLGPGPVAMDPLDPAYQIFVFGLDGTGSGSVAVPLAPGFTPPSAPPLFVDTVTFDGPLWSVSKTARIDWMRPNSWEAVAPLSTARQLHTATALGSGPRDNVTEVLICGGATGSIIFPVPMASAELFAPLTRTVSALPSMALPRASHRALNLGDGRVLITGGVTTGGVVTASCEFFDIATQTFTAAPPMNAPRAGHAITLLDNGRVLVTGGVADWQIATMGFVTMLNTAQGSAELFDPVTNSWSLLPTMAGFARFGHSQTKLLDGRVLIVNGISGGAIVGWITSTGQVPLFNPSCEVFDPTTSTFALVASPPFSPGGSGGVMRGFHGASLLPNGHVLITGGLTGPGSPGAAYPTGSCYEWDGLAWSQVAWLPAAVAFHTQEPRGLGALVVGGFTGDLTTLQTTAMVAQHDVTAVTSLADIGTDNGVGTPQPRGTHSCTRLCDGTFLIYGGGLWPSTLADGWICAPN